MFWFPVQIRDHKEPTYYFQRLNSKQIGLESRIWTCSHKWSYLTFSCSSVHARFVPFCITFGKNKFQMSPFIDLKHASQFYKAAQVPRGIFNSPRNP